jgi:uncharacterized metal-binding protein YceD (DUF177 family)
MRKSKLLDLNEAIQHPGKHVIAELSTELEEAEDLDLLEPLTGTLDAVSTGTVLLLRGVFHTTVALECARCLTPVEASVEFSVSEEFDIEGVPAGYGGSYAYVVTDEPTPLFEGNALIYEELLRQLLWVNLPSRILCREDCPGLGVPERLQPLGRPEFAQLAELVREMEEGNR